MFELLTTSTLCLSNHFFTKLLKRSGKSRKIRGLRSNNLMPKSGRDSRNSLASSIPLNPAPTIPTTEPDGKPHNLLKVSRERPIV